ncbi:hypothetical protein MRX96_012026 [Rhipicephalus microplus]
MGPVVNFFCFIVQISSLVYTWPCAASAASTNGSTSTIILIAVPAAQPDACATTAWMAPFHLLDQPIPSSTSAHPADLNVSPSSAPFSGQERAAAMGPVVNFFCFIVQISSLVYTWPCAASAASTNGSTSTIILIAVPAAQPDACATTAWMAPFHLWDQPIPSSTSAHPADLNVSPSSTPFSGQERAAAMGPVVNFFCFIVQFTRPTNIASTNAISQSGVPAVFQCA